MLESEKFAKRACIELWSSDRVWSAAGTLTQRGESRRDVTAALFDQLCRPLRGSIA